MTTATRAKRDGNMEALHLQAMPGWIWGACSLIFFAQIDQLIRTQIQITKFRRHLLNGVAFLAFILAIAPFIEKLPSTHFFAIFIPVIIIGIFSGWIVAKSFPVLIDPHTKLAYQPSDWLGMVIFGVMLTSASICYNVIDIHIEDLSKGTLLTLVLSINALLSGFFIGRNYLYIQEYHSLEKKVTKPTALTLEISDKEK